MVFVCFDSKNPPPSGRKVSPLHMRGLDVCSSCRSRDFAQAGQVGGIGLWPMVYGLSSIVHGLSSMTARLHAIHLFARFCHEVSAGWIYKSLPYFVQKKSPDCCLFDILAPCLPDNCFPICKKSETVRDVQHSELPVVTPPAIWGCLTFRSRIFQAKTKQISSAAPRAALASTGAARAPGRTTGAKPVSTVSLPVGAKHFYMQLH